MEYNLDIRLQSIAEIIEKTSMPHWFHYSSLAATIILTSFIIIITIINHKSNQKLEKMIHEQDKILQDKINEENKQIQLKMHNNEIRLKFYDSVLDIYKKYSESQNAVAFSNDKIISKLVYQENFGNWISLLNKSNSELTSAYNHARILFLRHDEQLFKRLEIIYSKYKYLLNIITQYYETGKFSEIHHHAWDELCRTTGIQKYDRSLLFTKDILEKMLDYLLTKETLSLQTEVDEFLKMFEYEEFDKYFEPYLSFDEFVKHQSI